MSIASVEETFHVNFDGILFTPVLNDVLFSRTISRSDRGMLQLQSSFSAATHL